MPLRFILVLLLTLPGPLLAAASSGNLMGYKHGGKYPRSPDTRQEVTTTGNLIITAERPVKPDDIAEVSLLATPGTLTIGAITAAQWFATEDEARNFGRHYFELLLAKYPDWPYGWEVMDAQMNVVEVNFKDPSYNLCLRLTKDMHNGKAMWRFSMTLGWLPESAPEQAWRKASASEQVAELQGTRQQLLKKSDLRGL
jgi:hypothetical protein